MEQDNAIKFYDTNALLDLYGKLDELGKFYTSSLVLHELEHIKTSKSKDDEVRYEARQVSKFLKNNPDNYECIVVQKKHHELLEELFLESTNDNLIIACAKQFENEISKKVIFITGDACCINIARNIFDMEVESLIDEKEMDNYKGFKSVIMTDAEMAAFYSIEDKENIYGLLDNEYLIIKDTLNQPLDAWCFNGLEMVQIDIKPIKSTLLGKLKAKDFYQQCVLDSFYRNTITSVKGKAGSGKSYLAMNFLLSQLEKDKIDKIIMFINDTPVRGSIQHGYLPGDLTSKLLDSQTGNFLLGKLGSKEEAMHLIQMGKLLLLPVSDIRGLDTSNMKAGIYITEAQNMSIDMIKLAMQRIGDDCICIVDGDCNSQVDSNMFEGRNNGMRRLSEVFRGKDIYGEMELNVTYRSKIAEYAHEL